MDYDFNLIIFLTTVGFFALAFILLFPVYRFMRREEEVAESWTPRALAERQRRPEEPASGDGASTTPPPLPRPSRRPPRPRR